MFGFSMIPAINKPTRLTSHTAAAIYNIITNPILNKNMESGIIKTDVSDHFPITFMINLRTTSSPKNHVDQLTYKRDFNEKLLNLFKQNLFKTSRDSLKNIADPNES